jgi:hypothetical protein
MLRYIEEWRNILGLGSVSSEERDNRTLYSDSAGDQLCFSMSMHTLPRSDIFMW